MKHNDSHISAEEKQRRKAKYTNMLILLAIMIAVTVVTMVRGEKAVGFDWSQTRVRITDPGGSTFTIRYADVTAMELTEHPHYGTCLDGGKSSSIHYGLWENETWGRYTLCASDQTTLCIVLRTAEEIYVLSYESDAITTALYESLTEFIE